MTASSGADSDQLDEVAIDHFLQFLRIKTISLDGHNGSYTEVSYGNDVVGHVFVLISNMTRELTACFDNGAGGRLAMSTS